MSRLEIPNSDGGSGRGDDGSEVVFNHPALRENIRKTSFSDLYLVAPPSLVIERVEDENEYREDEKEWKIDWKFNLPSNTRIPKSRYRRMSLFRRLPSTSEVGR